MTRATLRFAAPLITMLAVTACTDPITTSAPSDVQQVEAGMQAQVLACDLTKDMASDTRDYFQNPERRDAQALMRDLGSACDAGDAETTYELAVRLLRMVETAVGTGRGGDAQTGERLVNALLACTEPAGCTAAELPGLALIAAMTSPAGLFRVPTDEDDETVFARGGTVFTSTADGVAENRVARFVVGVTGTWSQANQGMPVLLLYGHSAAGNSLGLAEADIDGLQFQVDRWPDPGAFSADGLVHVGSCFLNSAGSDTMSIELQHDEETGAGLQPRLQRESETLLQPWTPPCGALSGESTTHASVFNTVVSFTRSVFASFAMRTDVRTTSIGGTPLDFSTFAPVAVKPNGTLLMPVGPDSVITADTPFSITIQALSGGQMPMEGVPVELYVYNNSGEPAGAEIKGNDTGTTAEPDGTVQIDGARIDKPGGYIICARLDGQLSGFTFEEACSDLFHIRK